jgi:hypothetical protein
VKAKPKIACLFRDINNTDGHDYDCDYEFAGEIGCDDCLAVGGDLDPRTGKKWQAKKGVAHGRAKKQRERGKAALS